jgi:hypothetical protein
MIGLTVRLLKSLGPVVDTNELEWESKVGKINSKIVLLLIFPLLTLTLTHFYLLTNLMILLVLLLIFPTLHTPSLSFVRL